MRLTEYLILEARKNPDQNQKMDTLHELEVLLSSYPRAFVTFTQIQKFGINPGSKYETPLGLYAYPLDWAINEIENEGVGQVFAADEKYAHVFMVKPTANIIDLRDTANFKNDKKQLITAAQELGLHTPPLETATGWKKLFKDIRIVIEQFTFTQEHKDPKTFDRKSRDRLKGIIFRKLFTKAGFDGIIDPGFGILYNKDEPTQAVFFNIKDLTLIETIQCKLASQELRNKAENLLARLQNGAPFDDIVGQLELIGQVNRVYNKTTPAYQNKLRPLLQQAATQFPLTAVSATLLMPLVDKWEGSFWEHIRPFFMSIPVPFIERAIRINKRFPPDYEAFLSNKLKDELADPRVRGYADRYINHFKIKV